MSEWETILSGGRKARNVKPGQGSLSAQLRHMAENVSNRQQQLKLQSWAEQASVSKLGEENVKAAWKVLASWKQSGCPPGKQPFQPPSPNRNTAPGETGRTYAQVAAKGVPPELATLQRHRCHGYGHTRR